VENYTVQLRDPVGYFLRGLLVNDLTGMETPCARRQISLKG
jgi:hypothetical protein